MVVWLAFDTTVALGLQAACVPGAAGWCADTGHGVGRQARSLALMVYLAGSAVLAGLSGEILHAAGWFGWLQGGFRDIRGTRMG